MMWGRVKDAPIDPQLAFRAGVLGWRFERVKAATERDFNLIYAFGPNERQMAEMQRLPGLVASGDAFRTGRSLRAIGKLLDRAGAPPSVGRQFIDNLVAAIITHHMRRTGFGWTETETIEMFMELYDRVLGGDTSGSTAVRDMLLLYARDEEEPLPGTRHRS
ncbi:hypothetical protein SAMN07250955_101328 [Arboricoccus pini]|uniref:Uncharacterized protein n=1 Tax=Arboricoccus pini TaxID=1963835 RepID=A0A212Q140_9PROT|nr:hypothetical protein [Arboricoccus pini]SNB53067.1 hypothetical protein SAMN07250955_101328 [Arboricoccus pini]